MKAFQEYCSYWIDYNKGSKSIKEQLDIQQKLYEKAVEEAREILGTSGNLNNGEQS
jgi:hypothetical protein